MGGIVGEGVVLPGARGGFVLRGRFCDTALPQVSFATNVATAKFAVASFCAFASGMAPPFCRRRLRRQPSALARRVTQALPLQGAAPTELAIDFQSVASFCILRSPCPWSTWGE